LKNYVAFPIKTTSPDKSKLVDEFLNPCEIPELLSEIAHDKQVFEQTLEEQGISRETIQDKHELYNILFTNYHHHLDLHRLHHYLLLQKFRLFHYHHWLLHHY